VELAPLAGLGAGPRARLTRTLRAWLDHPGQVQRVAGELHVHPQTVRYRMRALRELFGDALEDPERRFALGIALRVGQPAGIEDPRPAVGEYGASANSEADV
jgi:sugar diacid utilization regulator